MMKQKIWLMGLMTLALVGCRFEIARAQNEALTGRSITGTVYFIGSRTASRSLPFKLVIDRLSTSQEETALNSALQRGGQDELLRVLKTMDAGRIIIGNGVGITANAIFSTTGDDGRTKITVLYERYLRFGELRYGTRSADYRFGYAELFVGRGSNQGMLIPAAFIRLREGSTWEVEDFGTFPAQLMGLQIRGKGRSNIQ